MDYKQLSAVVENIGGMLSYSFEIGHHWYNIKINNKDEIHFSGVHEIDCFRKATEWLSKFYPIQYANALNQLNLK